MIKIMIFILSIISVCNSQSWKEYIPDDILIMAAEEQISKGDFTEAIKYLKQNINKNRKKECYRSYSTFRIALLRTNEFKNIQIIGEPNNDIDNNIKRKNKLLQHALKRFNKIRGNDCLWNKLAKYQKALLIIKMAESQYRRPYYGDIKIKTALKIRNLSSIQNHYSNAKKIMKEILTSDSIDSNEIHSEIGEKLIKCYLQETRLIKEIDNLFINAPKVANFSQKDSITYMELLNERIMPTDRKEYQLYIEGMELAKNLNINNSMYYDSLKIELQSFKKDYNLK